MKLKDNNMSQQADLKEWFIKNGEYIDIRIKVPTDVQDQFISFLMSYISEHITDKDRDYDIFKKVEICNIFFANVNTEEIYNEKIQKIRQNINETLDSLESSLKRVNLSNGLVLSE